MAVYSSTTMLLMLFLVCIEGTFAQANSTVGGNTTVAMATTPGVTQPMTSDTPSSAMPSTADTMTSDMPSTAMPSTGMRSTVHPDTTTDTAAVNTGAPGTTHVTSVTMTTDAMETATSAAIKANTTAGPVVLDPEELANQRIGTIMALSLAIPLNSFTAITLAVFIVGKRRKRVTKGADQKKLEAEEMKLETEDGKFGEAVDNRGFSLEEKNGKVHMTSSNGNSDQLDMENTKL
ncbi:integumentary mucin C.1-like [Branchiostoma lanceolatum]|uniref:integumentary mucin C.1-like n=1 Tax=Branchiostoma lanceolatum TaxID=7740 RepID=UPI003456428A